MPALRISSKLPHHGTSIFAEVSALAQQHQAINLGQGFPDFSADPSLIAHVTAAMQAGHNQYAPMPGLLQLRQQLAALYQANHGLSYDPATEITITSGATEAIFGAVQALVHPGDEVIFFEPAYDSYRPAIELAGGIPRPVKLVHPSYTLDRTALEAALSPRTRVLLLNTPHNPTGTVLPLADLEYLAALAEAHNLVVVSDEVYEFLRFPGVPYSGVAQLPALAARSLIIGSFGKSLHVTGWKVGYALAPAALSAELRKVHQFVTFATNTPFQFAISAYLEGNPDFWKPLGALFHEKQQALEALLQGTGLEPLPCQGTYFQLFSYAALSALPEREMALRLIHEAGVALIPNSAFYSDATDHKVLRFCFAKQPATLASAAERLQAWARVAV